MGYTRWKILLQEAPYKWPAWFDWDSTTFRQILGQTSAKIMTHYRVNVATEANTTFQKFFVNFAR